MRAKPCQSESVGIRLAVDQQQVGLDVAFPITCPVAAQVVIAEFCVKRLIGRQGHENGLQIAIERSPMLALGLALVVAFGIRPAIPS